MLKRMKRTSMSKNSTGTLRIYWDEGTAYSYRTKVAERIDMVWIITGRHYSNTTNRKHLGAIASNVNNFIKLPDGVDIKKEYMLEQIQNGILRL